LKICLPPHKPLKNNFQLFQITIISRTIVPALVPLPKKEFSKKIQTGMNQLNFKYKEVSTKKNVWNNFIIYSKTGQLIILYLYG